MEIRDARQDDSAAIVELSTGDIDPSHLLRERMVRVAVGPPETADVTGNESSVAGFLAFDVRPDAVHVTRIGGDREAVLDLLDDAIGFANREGLPVEAVVPTGGDSAAALEAKGFSERGAGPRFQGRDTTEFGLETSDCGSDATDA